MKKLIVLCLMMLLVLSGCSVSTSSSVSTTVTTDSGSTTTTTTVENGVSTTTVTNDDDPTGLRARWNETFVAGAEGESEAGNKIYFIYDDPSDISFGAIMITNSEGSELLVYDYGDILYDEEKEMLYIDDVDGLETLPFNIGDTDNDNTFMLEFQNGDVVEMEIVDKEVIIDDMISLWETHREDYQANHVVQ